MLIEPLSLGSTEALRGAFLDLELDVASSYYSFVYDSARQAREGQAAAFRADGCEFGPPWAWVMVDGDRLVGLYSAVAGSALRAIRLTSSMTLLRGPEATNPGTLERLRLAGRVSLKPDASDLYLSRIGVVAHARGSGFGRTLLEHVVANAKDGGLARIVLEVDPRATPAVRLYESMRFKSLGEHAVTDSASGRQYIRRWMARQVTPAG